MKRIIVKQTEFGLRPTENAFRATVEGNDEFWGWGRTADAAIGNLVKTYPIAFDIAEVHEEQYA